MSSISQPATFLELKTDLLNRMRESTVITAAPSTMAGRYINMALHDLHLNPGGSTPNWPWAIRRAVLLTHAPYTTGTVSITAAARTTVTGASTLWNTAVTGMGYNNVRVGGKIKFGNNEVYNVATVVSDTSLTLESRYTGDSAISAGSYTYLEDEYALATDFGKMVDARIFSFDYDMPLIGPMEFRRKYARNDILGTPRMATIIQLGFTASVTPQYRVVLGPAPDRVYSVPYDYITTNLAVSAAGIEQGNLVEDTDEPILPIRYRHALILHAQETWYRDLKDDTRSQEVKAEYIDLVARICNDFGIGQQNRPRIQPMRSNVGGYGGGRFDVNGRFDRMQ